MTPATWGLKKLGCTSEMEAHPDKPLICCHEAKGWAVEVLSHSAQPHGVFQPEAPAKERGMWVLLLKLEEPGVAWAWSAVPRDGNPDWLWGIKTSRRICHLFCSDREGSKLLVPYCVGKFHSWECFYPAHSQGCAASHDFSDACEVGKAFCNQTWISSQG